MSYKLHRYELMNIPRDTRAAIRVLHYFYTIIKTGVNVAPDFSFFKYSEIHGNGSLLFTH